MKMKVMMTLAVLGLSMGTFAGIPWKTEDYTLVARSMPLREALDSFGVQDKFASGPGLEDALLACPTRLFQRDEFDTLLNELKDKTSLSEGIMEDILNLFSESHTCHAMRKKAQELLDEVIDQLEVEETSAFNHYKFESK